MKISTVFATLILLLSCHFLFAQNKIVAYYPAWMTSELPPDQIQYEHVTHINQAFAWPNQNGDLQMYDNIPNPDLIQRAHQQNVQVLVSIGGWGNCDAFSPVLADSVKQQYFINRIVDFLYTYEYDGVDFDWEYPSNLADRNNYSSFIANLRERFKAENTAWLITMAVGTSDWKGQWFDYATLQQSVDFFNAMCYDYHGSWSAVSGHNAPLFSSNQNQDGSVQTGMHYLQHTRKIPATQLVVGIPFYGKVFNCAGLYASCEDDVTDLRYTDIYDKMNNGWNYHWDEQACVPYLIDAVGSKIITFEDARSIQKKCSWMIEQGYAGAMIWALGQDVIYGEQPLLTAVSDNLLTSEVGKQSTRINNEFSCKLFQNFPNPFNPSTQIQFALSRSDYTRLDIYNISGQLVETLVSNVLDAGVHQIQWQPFGLPNGFYLYRISTSSCNQTRRMLLIK